MISRLFALMIRYIRSRWFIVMMKASMFARTGSARLELVGFADTTRVIAGRDVQPGWCVTESGNAAKYAKEQWSEASGHEQSSLERSRLQCGPTKDRR
ncbi:hypothetical protein NHH03_15175 [Stieleria sp. TO1_6]|uniref:hypothetical protein n=1 Tax=Stieleria tagensis TaxID=2956795 RepID=UPI00209ABFD7|nr:hypothetical protein [Stieleria tagensis]MCO8123088.1 hypothetical protein [Stieleria tagensis]